MLFENNYAGQIICITYISLSQIFIFIDLNRYSVQTIEIQV